MERMTRKRTILWLSICVVVLIGINAGFGLFYNEGGQPRTVENIYGETIQLFGNGVYANNAMLKATTSKGTDLVMLFVAVGLLITAILRKNGPKTKLLHAGLLVSSLYYAVNTAFGLAFSRMFLLYLLMFSATFFAFVVTMIDLSAEIAPKSKDKRYVGTAVFTILSGCTVLVWLMSILPTLFTDAPLDIIGVSTTEPTFIVDIGLIFPVCVIGGIMLLKKKPLGYILPPMMLIFLVVIALLVVGQSVMQMRYGVILSFQEVVGYVATFVLFGIIAAVVSIRFMLRCWPGQKSARRKDE